MVLEEPVDVDEDGEGQDGDGYDGGRVPGELVVGSEERNTYICRFNILHIYYIQGVSKNVLIEQIITKIECYGSKFYQGHDLRALDPA